jgi:capsular exopolysaccharide synthesis family protein
LTPIESSPQEPGSALAVRQSNALSTHVVATTPVELDDSLHLRDLLRIVYKRKWWIVSAALLLLGIATFYTLVQTPIYRATAVIQIERNAARIIDFKDGGTNTDESYGYDSREFLNSQFELLRSKALAERVMESLRLDLEKKPGANADAPAIVSTAETTRDDLLARIADTLRKRREPSVKDAQMLDRESVLGSLRRSMTVEPIRNSLLVKIHVDNSDANLASRIANSWVQTFISNALERRFEASSYAKTFLEQQLAKTKERLEDSELQLNRYTRDKQIVNVDEKTSLTGQNFAEFTTALAKAQQERIKAEANFEEVKRNLANSKELLENKSIAAFKENKARLEAEYQDQLKIYKPGFPKMQQIQGQIDEIERRIQIETKTVTASILGTASAAFESAKSQESQLKARADAAKRTVLDVQDQGIRLNILKREVETNREIYNGLLQRLKQVGIAGGVGTNNVSIVDKADVPLFPYKPDLFRNAMIGLLLGLMAGLALAFILEYMDDSIKFPDEVERFTGMALLGIIPKVAARGSSVLAQATREPRSALAEAYRSLRTALQFSTARGAPRTIAITSCTKNEGKSTTAISLAVALSQLGKKVLLIDGDMRNPTLHLMLQADHNVGLSNLLSSDVDPIAVTKTTEFSGLYFISAGPLPPNPAELLAGMNLGKLLNPSASGFDHIVIDAPPILGIADAIVLCKSVDASIFVVESSRTRKSAIRNALKRLHQAGIHPLGAILTKLPGAPASYGYEADYYYYGNAEATALPGKA